MWLALAEGIAAGARDKAPVLAPVQGLACGGGRARVRALALRPPLYALSVDCLLPEQGECGLR